MRRYSIEPRTRKYLKGYGLLSLKTLKNTEKYARITVTIEKDVIQELIKMEKKLQKYTLHITIY